MACDARVCDEGGGKARPSCTNRLTPFTERRLHFRRAWQSEHDHVANGRADGFGHVRSDTGPPGRMLVLKLPDRESQKLGVPAALL